MAHPRFIPSLLDSIEHVEDYQPGGLHPISIGDLFADRYRVIHKLGFGGSSTIWMARDLQQDSPGGKLITMKAMRADISSKAVDALPEVSVPKMLHAAGIPTSDFQTVEDHFIVQGPNGSHRFLISPFAGPSVLAMLDCPGRVSGSRRLRGDLARRVAKNTTTTIHRMHHAGIVHDLTTSNVLFRVAEHVLGWSDSHVYANLGSPETEEVRTRSGEPRGPHAPAELVAPIDISQLVHSSLLQESIVLIDFGQSYTIANPPDDYQPGTILNCQSPETRFEGRVGVEADVWALGCAIFEMRAGFPLFESFLGSDADILRQTVETLGRLPDPWWSSFQERGMWFEEDGEPKIAEASKSSIQEQLRSVGTMDDPPSADEGPMMEKSGVRLQVDEVKLLGDLLERMLKYYPEERITMREIVEHPWFGM